MAQQNRCRRTQNKVDCKNEDNLKINEDCLKKCQQFIRAIHILRQTGYGVGAKPKNYTLWEEGEWQIKMYDSDERERRPDFIAYFKQETN